MLSTPTIHEDQAAPPSKVVPKRVAVLTNILLRHNTAVFEALCGRVREMRVFLSAENESDRKMPRHWGTLDVVVQRSIRWTRSFNNVHGYKDLRHLQFPYDTLAQLWSYRPDVIISGQFGGRTIFALLYKLLRPETRLIVWATLSQRTEMTQGRGRVLLRKLILRKADACFTHGKDSEVYLRSLGYKGPIFFTPYVIESGVYQGSSLVPDDNILRVLYTGQLIERKGIVSFTEAVAEWCRAHPEKHVQFTVGGEGSGRARMTALDSPPNLEMKLTGHLGLEEIVLAYRNASIYVFPTLADEWGMVVNEALSAGVPILASVHAQSSLEMVDDGVNGWLFDPSDAASVANGIDRAFNTDGSTLREMSENARNSVAAWTPEAMGARMAEGVRFIAGE